MSDQTTAQTAGESRQDDGEVQVAAVIDDPILIEAIRACCDHDERSRASLVRVAIKAYLSGRGFLRRGVEGDE